MAAELLERVRAALIASGQESAAAALEGCTVAISDDGDAPASDDSVRVVEIEIVAPPQVAAMLGDTAHPTTRAVRAALRAMLPANTWIQGWTCAVPQPDGDEPAHQQPANVPATVATPVCASVSNQAAEAGEVRVWQHLRFRSESELRVAQALDRAGVLFLPNCKARLGPLGHRENREPDFLVCSEGKWGILEVDGEPFHPAARTVHDHERARLFKAHGVRVVEHFDAAACFADPDRVVRQFLALLRQA